MHRFLTAAILGSALAASGVAPAHTPACEVAGEKVGFGLHSDIDDEVIIRPPGASPFRLRPASAERVVVTIPAGPRAPTPIEVHGVISFSGTTGPLSYRVSRAFETSQGMVKVYIGATIVKATAHDDGVLGAVEFLDPPKRWNPCEYPATPWP